MTDSAAAARPGLASRALSIRRFKWSSLKACHQLASMPCPSPDWTDHCSGGATGKGTGSGVNVAHPAIRKAGRITINRAVIVIVLFRRQGMDRVQVSGFTGWQKTEDQPGGKGTGERQHHRQHRHMNGRAE